MNSTVRTKTKHVKTEFDVVRYSILHTSQIRNVILTLSVAVALFVVAKSVNIIKKLRTTL
jgi:uncharacterized protein YaiI (UPF0178 family)